MVLRYKNGEYRNLFNVKSNGELAAIAFDWEPRTVGGSGIDGFIFRLTFSGQEKLGAVQRIAPGEDLQLIIQDDLTGLVSLVATAEGHEVED